MIEDEAQVIRRVHQHLADREQRARKPPAPIAASYDAADLKILLGDPRS
jgi:hypothetical protein